MGGERQEVELKMVSSCVNDAMVRQVIEVILMKELSMEIKTKDEWGNSNALREKGSFDVMICRIYLKKTS